MQTTMMRKIERTAQFRRDYKRVGKGQYRATLNDALSAVLELLVVDQQLEPRLCDHAMTGHWKGYRDCHIKPDLVLVYQKIGADVLRLMRLGSHSELEL